MTTQKISHLVADAWLTTAEAASYARRSTVTIRRHAAAGTLRSTQPGRGRGRRYRREWIDEWVTGCPELPAKRLAG